MHGNGSETVDTKIIRQNDVVYIKQSTYLSEASCHGNSTVNKVQSQCSSSHT